MKVSLAQIMPVLGFVAGTATVFSQANVLTYHNHISRDGWNPNETVLTPENVKPATFGLIQTVPLTGQVDSQPLFVSNLTIPGKGVHSVVYVATEANQVYGLDSVTGETLLPVANLGPPAQVLPYQPGGCSNSSPYVGVSGTGTIDLTTNTLYVVAYTTDAATGRARYDFHALDLITLADKGGSPFQIKFTYTLGDGTTTNFNPAVQRQRPGLLDMDGKIFAAFGSFCDYSAESPQVPFIADRSRGWIVSLDKSTHAMKYQTTNRRGYSDFLNSQMHTPPNQFNATCDSTNDANKPCYLSSIWMSGYGLAGDGDGHLYFNTGNSSEGTYNVSNTDWNLAESAVKMATDLTTSMKSIDWFTPGVEDSLPWFGGSLFTLDYLETHDQDFGAGGIMLLPDQPGRYPHIAIAIGKPGNMYVLNRDDMSGRTTGIQPQGNYMGACWCGFSTYQFEGNTMIVSSAGGWPYVFPPAWPNVVGVYALQVPSGAPSAPKALPHLGLGSWSVPLEEGNSFGFFTSVSSDGVVAGSQIVWAVGSAAPNPTDFNGPMHLTLYAFNPANAGSSPYTLPILWQGVAGTWSLCCAHPNTVPTVANGRVYVASDGELMIFGLLPPAPCPSGEVRCPVLADRNRCVPAASCPKLPVRLLR